MYVPPPSTLPDDLKQLYIQWQGTSCKQARIISDATQFVDIAPYIDTGVDPVSFQPVLLDLKCPCCGYHLDVPARVSPNLYPDASLEPMTVLPCGHMIGSHCMDNWIRSRDAEKEPPNCPVCRFELAYKHCGCLIRTPGYNTLLSRAAQLPLTFVEGGAVDHNCGPCRDRRADWALRTWIEEHLPSDRTASSTDASLTRAQQRRLQACVGDVARSARNWHREHSPRW
ncbi:uncharacterized protein PG998_003458 [Apiospora kogelbergensis]|uniref:uncharacterized protein n=1 Tax=Apiospora kogelbergensis TaxID=1337665 RepID=UPI00312F0CEE